MRVHPGISYNPVNCFEQFFLLKLRPDIFTANLNVGKTAFLSRPDLFADAVQHPFVNFRNQAGFFGQRYEFGWR
jgi:hypothetical protein